MAVVLLSSFAAWIYCIATVVLGLIYQAYPGQENVAILISTLPTIVMMLAAFASSVILRVCNRKLVVVVSMAISIVAVSYTHLQRSCSARTAVISLCWQSSMTGRCEVPPWKRT